MVMLIDVTQNFAQSDNLKLFFNGKETNCTLYSEEGIEFKIHKEILGQTKFLRDILLNAKDNSCAKMEILCPCSKSDLEYLVRFLYTGKICYSTEMELFRILNNLCEIFGFPKERFLPDNYTDIEEEFEITNLSNTVSENYEHCDDSLLTSNRFKSYDPIENISDTSDLELEEEELQSTSNESKTYVCNENLLETSGLEFKNEEFEIVSLLNNVSENYENNKESTLITDLGLENEEYERGTEVLEKTRESKTNSSITQCAVGFSNPNKKGQMVIQFS